MTSKTTYVLGLDGGASHTRVVILDQQQRVVGRGESGSANHQNIGLDKAAEAIQMAVKQAIENTDLRVADLSGGTWALAGAGRLDDQQHFRALAAHILPNVPLQITHDALAALIGGLGHRQGVILIAGTGMMAYGEDEHGQSARAGGYGTLLDQGSGYAIAVAGLKAMIAAADGQGHATDITHHILKALKMTDTSQLVAWLYHPSRTATEIAHLAPQVLELAEKGDMVAVDIAANQAQALADAVVAVVQQLDFQARKVSFTYAGSLLTKQTFYRQLVCQLIQTKCPHLQVQTPLSDGSVGAGLLALDSLGKSALKAHEGPDPKSNIWASEQRNVLTMDLDLKTTVEILGAMHVADKQAVASVDPLLPKIATVVDQVVQRMRQGGRLLYTGAGTSGRLGVLDASECPPTFNTAPNQVIGIIAGGQAALTQSQEGAEDRHEDGAKALLDLAVNKRDTVIGIAASGQTPFVIGALEVARKAQALTVAITCNVPAAIAEPAQHVLAPLVGPEVITGSTRLKAGTAQKLILNMISTGVMVRLGKTYGNLMVDVQPSNQKLQARAKRIVAQACDVSIEVAAKVLHSADGEVKTAIVMHLLGCSASQARNRLQQAQGVIRDII
ncbi:MAG: N-acetylmuramic acid 6-phosphate etherase [Chloroflexota bacterium]